MSDLIEQTEALAHRLVENESRFYSLDDISAHLLKCAARMRDLEAQLDAAEATERARWYPVEPPRDTWLKTRREGEGGENVCMLASFGDEWLERDGGRTTITHAAPTHWQPLP